MKKKSFSKKLQISLTMCFCVLVFILSFINRSKPSEVFKQFIDRDLSFSSMTESLARSYLTDEFVGKTWFVNINGLFAKVTARRCYNNITRLNNGMLSSSKNSIETMIDETVLSNVLNDFTQALQKIDIPFLYVQAPYKMDLKEELLPVGMTEFINDTIDKLLRENKIHSINTIDLRPDLTSTPEQVELNFYRTDYHWTPDGAFIAFQRIMNWVKENCNLELDTHLAVPEYWSRHENMNWFLGSQGKRVGVYFAGVDPLIWLTPNFDTNVSCSIPKHREIFMGDFSDAFIRKQYIYELDYFHDNPYCIYIGGNYPLYRLRNAEAPNEMRLLILQDSFSLILAPLLSSEFTEIDVIDPRYYTRSSIYDYCKWTKPDLVIMMLSPGSITNEQYYTIRNGEVDESNYQETIHLLDSYDFEIPAYDNSHNYFVIPIEIKPGKTYRFSLDSLSLSEGNTAGISVLVYDFSSNKIISEEILAIDCFNFSGDNQVFFNIPQGEIDSTNYKLLVYSGFFGRTQGISVKLTGVTVDEIS